MIPGVRLQSCSDVVVFVRSAQCCWPPLHRTVLWSERPPLHRTVLWGERPVQWTEKNVRLVATFFRRSVEELL